MKDKGPEEFLAEAWKLIQSAREHVLRPQTHAEYLAAHRGSDEAAENVVGRIRVGVACPVSEALQYRRR